MSPTWRNWGRSAVAHPVEIARPGSAEEVAAVVREARERGLTVKAIGAGHSFTAIAAADGVQVDVSALGGIRRIDGDLVTIGAGTRLHDLTRMLHTHGLALENMGDIDRQTLAGATSTGTHGTGARFGGLATRIAGATLVTAGGGILTVSERENAELLGAVQLGLGALGILTDITVRAVPAFLLHAIERPAGLEEVLDDFEPRMTAADHVEFYWWPHTERVMTKQNTRLPADAERRPVGPLANWIEERLLSNVVLAAKCAVGRVVPALTPPINRLATRVYGDREYVDHSHEVFTAPRDVRFRELEYALPRAAVPSALRELRRAIDDAGWRIEFPVEVRVAARDDTWLSTSYGRDSGYIAVHRSIREDPAAYFAAAERIFLAHDGRPHWGKMHTLGRAELEPRYPRFADFLAVRGRLDPEHVFTNPYLDRVLS
ncbi:D-arabinono-1,4-lactone oxidase [Pseudolysinimonas kribbensis]|uniref:FAD-linked oxidoreductase n=1 Tax=Pseudolysinimonas kribbensis TaxID=433641 RepID=A0ABQ6K6Y9_9MICO|nr:D-arabinono-1,4-lactone oxidase [Pseudolysinimonas kribbensis]GMA96218.1 FAD-linked oxidoreductase [Pseudolysinimonas kribbensis]